MDRRDAKLLQHHQRRLLVAARYSLERQRRDAELHLQIAVNQRRLAYAVLMRMWLDSLE